MRMSTAQLLRTILILAVASVSRDCFSQSLSTFELRHEKLTEISEIPVSINLDEITYLHDSVLVLYEISTKGKRQIPFQIEQGNPRTLTFITGYGFAQGEKITYELVSGENFQTETVGSSLSDGALVISSGGKNLLRYNFKTIYPPAGIDTAYKRSGFIHPLWSPGGQVLTRIQPPDHYHHYGIWNPWTHVLFRGDTVDFWNINSRQGTVRFANFVSVVDGPVFSEYSVLHEHVVFRPGGREEVALNELQKVRVYRPANDKSNFIVDFLIQLNCAGENEVRLLEYRYGGLGWRTTGEWDNKNSTVLTSEGRTRKNADGTKALWCVVQGATGNDHAGVVMMSHPTNYNHPEPLRIWPEDQYGRGDMFANFSPTRDTDWLLVPGKTYVLRYRFLVFNGHTNVVKAAEAWKHFAYPPVTVVTKTE